MKQQELTLVITFNYPDSYGPDDFYDIMRDAIYPIEAAGHRVRILEYGE